MTTAKKPKLTFRREPEMTGLMHVSYPYPAVAIKHDKLEVGTIVPPQPYPRTNYWSVRFMLDGSPADNPNCPWRWREVRNRFPNEQAARDWVQENAAKIIKWGLWHRPKEDTP